MAKKKLDGTETNTSQETDFLSLYQQFKKGTVDPSQRKYISTGHASIDSLLSGGKGLPLGSYIELSSKSGCGKCVTGDTIVLVNNKLQRIDTDIINNGFTESLNDNEHCILSRNGNVDYSHKYKEHVSTIVTISDVHGNKISCTPIHPLLVYKENGDTEWVNADKIKLKDRIVMTNIQNNSCSSTQISDIAKANVKSRYSKDLSCIYSYLEGYDLLKKKSYWKYGFMVDVSQTNIEEICNELEYYGITKINDFGEYEHVERNINQYKLYTHKKDGKEDKIYVRVDLSEKDVLKHVDSLVDEERCKECCDDEKEKIFYRPITSTEFFAKIAGMLDAAGNIYNNSRDVSFRKISLFTNKKEDISFVQKMLAMFGIIGHQSIVQNYKYKYCLNLTITSSLALANYIKPFVILKRKELDEFINSFESNVIQEKQNYLKVSEICVEAKECFVYDYSIPSTHEFIANGIVSHNTTLVLDIVKHVCEQGYRVLYIDVETGLSENLLKKMGLMEYYDNLFIVFTITTFDKCGELLDSAVKDPNTALIIVDSLTALTPDELVATGKKISEGRIGIQAVNTGNLLKRYRERINNNEKSMIFINQMRTHIPMGYGNAYDAPAGANAQQFTMDIRLLMKCVEQIKAPDGHQIGAVNKIWAIKNRHTDPFIETTTKLMFGKGVDETDEYSNWLIDNGVVEKKMGGNYTITWNGSEIKIKGQINYESWINENIEEIKSFVDAHGGLIPIMSSLDEQEESEEESSEEELSF